VTPPDELYGTWKLVSYVLRIEATGERTKPFGSAPRGFLSYGRDGRMTALIVKDERPRPVDMARATPEERIELYDTLVAYGGTFTFHGDRVVHHVDISWSEEWTGTDQVRHIRLEGDRLHITSDPRESLIDGRIVVAELLWEKVRGGG
jgi:hypothetical protein